MSILAAIFWFVRGILRRRAALALENLALRQKLAVLRRTVKRPRLRPRDRSLGPAAALLPGLALASQPGETRHSCSLAPTRLQAVLEMEVPERGRPRLRLLRRPHCHLPAALLLRGPGPRAPAHHPLQRHTHPSAGWTAQQIIEAFPADGTEPKYLLRDRDSIYGDEFRRRVQRMGIKQVVTARRSPWQNPYAERVIGSIRRECTDHVIVFGEEHLRRILLSYQTYYNEARTHLSLERNSPVPRRVEPPSKGRVIAIPQVGGLHHLYSRAA